MITFTRVKQIVFGKQLTTHLLHRKNELTTSPIQTADSQTTNLKEKSRSFTERLFVY